MGTRQKIQAIRHWAGKRGLSVSDFVWVACTLLAQRMWQVEQQESKELH